jgi:hypothetical protein
MAAPDDVQAQVAWRSARALVLADSGDTDAAESLARGAVEMARHTDDLNLRARALLAHAAALTGDERETAAAEALALLDEKGNVAGRRRAEAALG